jgi:4'-phosphopantetheinyl transferase
MLSVEAVRRFIVSHGATRGILGRYLDERPEQIRVLVDGRGKPHLVPPADGPAICFSLSHSGELALCAVTEGRDVGVDIERIRPVSAWREIAARYFSDRENETLCSLAGDQACEAFFQGWTRKEAYTKALGYGVSRHWTRFTVSLQPGAPAELLNAAAGAPAGDLFTLCPLAPEPGYVATIAAQGAGWRLSCWQW